MTQEIIVECKIYIIYMYMYADRLYLYSRTPITCRPILLQGCTIHTFISIIVPVNPRMHILDSAVDYNKTKTAISRFTNKTNKTS